MTKQELQGAVESYIALNADIETIISRALSSGAVDCDTANSGTVQAIAHAVLLSAAGEIEPRHSVLKQYSENLQLFV